MKKSILIMINILIINSALFAQNAIDPIVLPNNLCRLNSSVINRNVGRFVIGWNNGTPNRVLDSILNISYSNHVWMHPTNRPNWYYGTSIDYMQNQNRSLTVGGIIDNVNNIICLKSYSMFYEPVITVDTTNTFTPSGYNAEGALWGWLQKHANIQYYSETDIANRGHIQLRKSVFTGNTKILWDVYPKNDLYYHDYSKTLLPDTSINKYNGNQWYLSVNLKSKEALNSKNYESAVITIKLPYKYYDANGISNDDYIKFTQIPAANTSNLALDTIQIRGTRGDFRGYGRRETAITAVDRFEIKGKMLALSNSIGKDSSITLCAYFEFGPNIPNDKRLKELYGKDSLVTYQIDVEVEYNDAIDVDLNWVKLETATVETSLEAYGIPELHPS